MEQKDKKLTTIVRGYPVSFGFTEEPQKELSGKMPFLLKIAACPEQSRPWLTPGGRKILQPFLAKYLVVFFVDSGSYCGRNVR